jgi:O-antigen/teichoic acid export membrane protein
MNADHVSLPPKSRISRLLSKATAYSLAALGPLLTAVTQFLLALLMIRHLSAAEFGLFSFTLVIMQFGSGIWSALFCAPLPIVIAQRGHDDQTAVVQSLFTANLLLALCAALLFLGVGHMLGLSLGTNLMFASLGALGLLRWFARAYSYARGEPRRTTLSDLSYASVVGLGTLGLFFSGSSRLIDAYGVLLASTVMSLIFFGLSFLKSQFASLSFSTLGRYREVWNKHARWALVGVVTTEATANAHAYMVIFLSGPRAFAPLAASALLIRPVTVFMNALTEFERPAMARQIAAGNIEGALRSLLIFRLVLCIIWLGTSIAAITLVVHIPRLIFPAEYGQNELLIGLVLWLLVAAARAGRTPESTLLQAAGVFRELAKASVYSSVFSIMAVLAILLLAGPLWSIAGILCGELVFLVCIWRQTRLWRRNQSQVLPTLKDENAP